MIENIKKKLIDYGYGEIIEHTVILSLFGNRYSPTVNPICLCNIQEKHSLLIMDQGARKDNKWLFYVIVRSHESPLDPISYIIPKCQVNEDLVEIIRKIAKINIENQCIKDLQRKRRAAEKVRRDLITFMDEENSGLLSIYHNQWDIAFLNNFLVIGDDIIFIEEFGIPAESIDIIDYKLVMCIKKSLKNPAEQAKARCCYSDSWRVTTDYDNQGWWSEWTSISQATKTIEISLLKELCRAIERAGSKSRLSEV